MGKGKGKGECSMYNHRHRNEYTHTEVVAGWVVVEVGVGQVAKVEMLVCPKRGSAREEGVSERWRKSITWMGRFQPLA